jgi:hypothetical protein
MAILFRALASPLVPDARFKGCPNFDSTISSRENAAVVEDLSLPDLLRPSFKCGGQKRGQMFCDLSFAGGACHLSTAY